MLVPCKASQVLELVELPWRRLLLGEADGRAGAVIGMGAGDSKGQRQQGNDSDHVSRETERWCSMESVIITPSPVLQTDSV